MSFNVFPQPFTFVYCIILYECIDPCNNCCGDEDRFGEVIKIRRLSEGFDCLHNFKDLGYD